METRVDAAVARSGGQAERLANKLAQEALFAERLRLRKLGTWKELDVEEYAKVVERRKGPMTNFGRLIATIIETTSELPRGHKD